MFIRSFVFALILHSGAWAYTEPDGLRPFKSDGCTSSPEGNWGVCCYEHDISYWAGGSFEDRKRADERLRSCVNVVGGPGHIYYEFVRNGGITYFGNAWPNHHRNQKISELDRDAIQAERRLWDNLGRPSNFNYVALETTLFKPLTRDEFARLHQKFQAVFKSPAYKKFYQAYHQATGREPSSKIFH